VRREDQERDGVEAEVIYGIIGISRGFFGSNGITDPALLADVYRAYNQYIAGFNQALPGRFYGLGCPTTTGRRGPSLRFAWSEGRRVRR